MHADLLYHRLLAQEKAIETAQKAGSPIPQFPPINSPDQTPKYPVEDSKLASQNKTQADELPELSEFLRGKLQPHTEDALRRRLKDMTPAERELEERSMLGEYNMSIEAAGEFVRHRDTIVEGRQKRRVEGHATTFDTISGWFGW